MGKEIYINPATGAPELDEYGDFVMTEGPETSLYLAIATEIDSLFGAPGVGSHFPAMVTGAPVADVAAALRVATALALRPLEAQGIIDVQGVRINGNRVVIQVRQLATPFVMQIGEVGS